MKGSTCLNVGLTVMFILFYAIPLHAEDTLRTLNQESLLDYWRALGTRYSEKIKTIDKEILKTEEIIKSARAGQGPDNPNRNDNIKAEGIALEALRRYKNARSKYVDLMRKTKREYDLIDKSLVKLMNSKQHNSICLDCRGEVLARGPGNPDFKPVSPEYMFNPGDTIRAQEEAMFSVLHKNGAITTVTNGSIIIPNEINSQPLEILKGKMHYWKQKAERKWEDFLDTLKYKFRRKFEPNLKCRHGSASVRGTEFDFEVDGASCMCFTLYDGEVLLAVDPDDQMDYKKDCWWLNGTAGGLKNPSGDVSLLRVNAVIGEALGKTRNSTEWRLLSPGDTLLPGDSLKTGFNSLVHAELSKKRIAVIGENSIFQAGKDKTSGLPIYGLWSGKLYFSNAQVNDMLVSDPPTLLTPNNVIKLRCSEFEVLVDECKLAHITLYKNSIEIDADGSRLAEEEYDHWWDGENK